MTLRVKVKPSSRASSFAQQPDGTWIARLTSPPVGGRANEELLALVAEHFHCRKSAVRLRSGAAARMKTLEIDIAS